MTYRSCACGQAAEARIEKLERRLDVARATCRFYETRDKKDRGWTMTLHFLGAVAGSVVFWCFASSTQPVEARHLPVHVQHVYVCCGPTSCVVAAEASP